MYLIVHSPFTGLIDVVHHIDCSLLYGTPPLLQSCRKRQAMGLGSIIELNHLRNNANMDAPVQCISNGNVTSLATMSSRMRMKSRRWWASTPKSSWMFCRSAAMSGSVDESAQRLLHLMNHSQFETPCSTNDKPILITFFSKDYLNWATMLIYT